MASEKNYIYAREILNDPDLIYFLTDDDIDELEYREEPVYYLSKRRYIASQYNNSYDSDKRLLLREKDSIDFRYEVIRKLGKGAFGNVYLCQDHKRNMEVALKVLRKERRFHKQAKIEVGIYDVLNDSTKYNLNVIQMLKAFTYDENIFMVFPHFGIDLYSYYKNNVINSLDLQSFAKQIANGMEFIHSFSIIHMDLKPENILVHNNKHLKIIDLGSSLIKKEEKTLYRDYIQSRYYRSPEVVFNMEITDKIDVWSYGCILYEMLTRTPLIPARSTNDLVIFYCHILGYPPKEMVNIYNDQKYFIHGTRELRNFKTKRGKFLYPNDFELKYSNIALKQLIFKYCLGWDSKKRFSMSEILKHPYFLSIFR